MRGRNEGWSPDFRLGQMVIESETGSVDKGQMGEGMMNSV